MKREQDNARAAFICRMDYEIQDYRNNNGSFNHGYACGLISAALLMEAISRVDYEAYSLQISEITTQRNGGKA